MSQEEQQKETELAKRISKVVIVGVLIGSFIANIIHLVDDGLDYISPKEELPIFIGRTMITECVDTRDGSVFVFSTESIDIPEYSIYGENKFFVTDTKGNKREFNSSSWAWYICNIIKREDQYGSKK